MKFFVAVILTALLSFAGALFFPWWIVAIAAFIVSVVVHQNAFPSFFAAFLALFILWGAQCYFIDNRNEHLLSTKVASILPLGGSFAAVIIVTAFIGGLVGGMGALTASFIRREPEDSKKY